MLDFQIKKWQDRGGGLNMGLCPGRYAAKQSRQGSIFIAEKSFLCIESTIRQCSHKYSREYSHWGVTEITRQEWLEIISKLGVMRQNALRASNPEELLSILPSSESLEREFREHFESNRNGLSGLIGNLEAWVQKTLSEYDSISILGV